MIQLSWCAENVVDNFVDNLNFSDGELFLFEVQRTLGVTFTDRFELNF